MREVFCSMSTERSRKSSSLLRTVSQHRHLVSLVRVPWKISWTQVFSTGLPASLRWATGVSTREVLTRPPFTLPFPFPSPTLKHTSNIVSNGVEEVVEKFVSILLLHIVKQPCRQERRGNEGRATGAGGSVRVQWIPLSFLTFATNFLG